MQMRFFNQLADIKRRYDDLAFMVSQPDIGTMFLATWNVKADEPEKLALLREEHAAITYLAHCQMEMARDTDDIKPDMAVLESVFNRHLDYIDRVHGCNAATWRKHPFKSVRKEYEACRHYLFKLSLPAWVEKLPAVIQTFDNKYPDFHKKREIKR